MAKIDDANRYLEMFKVRCKHVDSPNPGQPVDDDERDNAIMALTLIVQNQAQQIKDMGKKIYELTQGPV